MPQRLRSRNYARWAPTSYKWGYPHIRPGMEVISPFITGMGPPCTKESRFFLHFLIQHGRCQNRSFFGFTLSAILHIHAVFCSQIVSLPGVAGAMSLGYFLLIWSIQVRTKKGPTRFGFGVFGMRFLAGWKQKHHCSCLFFVWALAGRQQPRLLHSSQASFGTLERSEIVPWNRFGGKKQPPRNKPLLRGY